MPRKRLQKGTSGSDTCGGDRSLLGELVVDDHKQPLGVEGGPAEEEREDYSSWRQKKTFRFYVIRSYLIRFSPR